MENDENDGPIDDFSKHEVVHTSSIVGDIFDKHLAEHRWVQSDPELKQLADDISSKLGKFYQLSASKSVSI